MTHANPERPSAEAITALLADRVRELRRAVGLSQAGLADRMSQAGIPWTRLTVVNLEKRGGDSRGSGAGRDAVTAQELLTLALVLHVPPVLLLADPRRPGPVPVAEGVELGAWEALLWMIGSTTIGGGIASQPVSDERFDLIWHGRAVAEAAGAIAATSLHLGGQVTVIDDPRGARVGTFDDLHRGYLDRIAGSLERIAELGAPVPRLGPKVLSRARELGVPLPGQDGEG